MKKTYISPELHVAYLAEELPIAQSNRVNGSSVSLNPNTMVGADGSDAVKRDNTYDVWDDDWSR